VPDLGRTLIVTGLAITALGVVVVLTPKLPWLGRLPGDIHIEREHFAFHFPIVTCLIASLLLTILLNIFLRR
jgi:DUF2905 family protein